MHTAIPASAAPEVEGDDSIETLGLSGTTLMQLWSIGVSTVSDLGPQNSPDLKKRLSEALGKSASANSRIEKALAEVRDTLAKRNPVSERTEPATVIEIKVSARQTSQPDPRAEDEQTEKEYVDPYFKPKDPLDYFTRDMKRYPLLSHDKQMELARRVREDGDEKARRLLVLHNLRLVFDIARRHRWSKLEILDLIQEGSIGLMTAIEKFDHTLGYAFSTYATHWIRQAITRAIMDKGQVIRVPVHLQDLAQKVQRVIRVLSAELGRVPTMAEVATAAEATPDRVKKALKAMRMEFVSADTTPVIGQNSDREVYLVDVLADEASLNGEQLAIARAELDEALNRVNYLTEDLYDDETISERNREIFVKFYGLDGSLRKRTLEHVSEGYDMTRERVRQVIAKCWEKLQLEGSDMDHDSLLEDLERIAALEKLARKLVSVT